MKEETHMKLNDIIQIIIKLVVESRLKYHSSKLKKNCLRFNALKQKNELI